MIRSPRLWTTCALTMVWFFFLVTRLGYLQLYCHASLSQKADRQRSGHGIVLQPRGPILDRNGAILAMNLGGGSCFADPKLIRNRDETARALGLALQMPAAAIHQKLSQRKRFVWIARRLDPETTQRLQELRLPGIRVLPETKRFYPEDTLAAHLLGVVGAEQEGLSGVERIADGWLTGEATPVVFKGWSFAKDAPPPFKTPASSRRSLVLTLDRTLQTIVEQQLAIQMKTSRPKAGTVIMQDASTGEILAMASAPTFNPNLWGTPAAPGHYGPETLKNPSIERVIEPGSTFKIVTAAAGLEERLFTPADGLYCENGAWKAFGRTIHDHEKGGWLTLTQILAQSSNIGTAKVAMRLGQENMYRYARAFGFGMPTGIGLPGDATGILRTTRQWQAGSLATISFGQEIGVTPLQMVNAFAVVAHGGRLLEPRLYKGVIDERGVYREWLPRQPVRQVLSPQTVAHLRRMLQTVVAQGTGKAAQVAGISTAGKTGTAQKIDPATRTYSPDKFVASFVGYAPADRPRVVVGVFLDEPEASQWGSAEAAPLFSRIIRDAARYLRIEVEPVGPLATSRMNRS